MGFLGHVILFFAAGFTGYLMNADRGNSLGVFLLLALPILGVYFVGWWALLTVFVGLIFGGRVFWSSVTSRRGGPEE
jgi:hypothetical protein